MVKLEPRKPIETKTAKIEVDPGIPPGRYRLTLVVIDESGNESRPAVRTIEIIPQSPRIPSRVFRTNRDREPP